MVIKSWLRYLFLTFLGVISFVIIFVLASVGPVDRTPVGELPADVQAEAGPGQIAGLRPGRIVRSGRAGRARRDRPGLRLRGPDPLEPPRARARAAARLHPTCGRDGPDRADRSLGDARGMPIRGRVAGALPERAPAAHGREPIGATGAAPRDRRGRATRNRRRRCSGTPRGARQGSSAACGVADSGP